MGGFIGTILQVDLASGAISPMTVEEKLFRQFIGGSGIAAKIFLDRFRPDVEPLSPENPFLVMTGPLTGTNFPGSSRFVVCGKSPLTGIWGESAIGGNFSPELKIAGYDGVLCLGAAEAPVYLLIQDGKAEIRDASRLWGKDTYETTDILKRELGSPFKILCIGQAGEHLVRYAAIANDKAHYAGRTGMGAVMGSKRLKAIAVRGSGRIRIESPDAYKAAFTAVVKGCKESMVAQSLHEMGTDGAMDLGMVTGDVPIKNWTIGQDFDLSANLGGPALTERHLVRAHACSFCPIACKRVVKVTGGPYELEEGPGPEYETCAAFGTMILNADLAAVAKANEICNRYGMDTISCGSTIAFAMECYEKGLLRLQDTEGLAMQWGDMGVVLQLLPKIAHRDGFGDLLAEGTRGAAVRIGGDAKELGIHVKGLELPMHDPRGFHGIGLAYAYSTRGACHNQHAVLPVEQGWVTLPELGLREDYQAQTSEGKAEMVFICENYGTLLNALCQCHFVNYATPPKELLGALNAITGWSLTMGDLLACGERIWLLKRGLVNLMGSGDSDDLLPKRILTPVAEGGAAGSVPDLELMKQDYKRIRGLNAQGRPSPETLEKKGLDDLARRLHPQS